MVANSSILFLLLSNNYMQKRSTHQRTDLSNSCFTWKKKISSVTQQTLEPWILIIVGVSFKLEAWFWWDKFLNITLSILSKNPFFFWVHFLWLHFSKTKNNEKVHANNITKAKQQKTPAHHARTNPPSTILSLSETTLQQHHPSQKPKVVAYEEVVEVNFDNA